MLLPYPRLLPLAALLTAQGCVEPTAPAEFPEPDAWSMRGPGLGSQTYDPSDLFAPCSFLDGGQSDPTLDEDDDHHNTVMMVDGHLVMPFAPEWSSGGVAFFDVVDPCAPTKVGEGLSDTIRESHTIALARREGRILAAFDHHEGIVQGELLGGIEIWDITDPTSATVISHLDLPGYAYPDAYARVTLSTFWAGHTLWVSGADNGIYAIDVEDPAVPALIAQHIFEPPLRVGAVHVVGGIGMASTAEGSRTVLFDATDPGAIEPLPGGDFAVTDESGSPKEYYFANLVGPRALFARKEDGGGPIVYDLRDPTGPVRVGGARTDGGNGGYVFANKDDLFVGDSHWGVVFDFSDPSAPIERGRAVIPGDLDTNTPLGQWMVLAVDEESLPDQASAIVPWSPAPDSLGPQVGWSWPVDAQTFVPSDAVLGLSFDEMVELMSLHDGSVRIAGPDGAPVPGQWSLVEAIATFVPDGGWLEDSSYTVTVPAGGVADVTGNRVTEEFTMSFSTGAGR